MTDYAAPLQDMRFVLEHVAGLDAVASLPGHGSARMESIAPLLEGGARFYERVWAPTNRPADLAGSHLRDGRVVVLDALHAAYRETMAGSWTVLPREPQAGDDGVPWLVHAAIIEMAVLRNRQRRREPEDLAVHGPRRARRLVAARRRCGAEAAVGILRISQRRSRRSVRCARARARRPAVRAPSGGRRTRCRRAGSSPAP